MALKDIDDSFTSHAKRRTQKSKYEVLDEEAAEEEEVLHKEAEEAEEAKILEEAEEA